MPSYRPQPNLRSGLNMIRIYSLMGFKVFLNFALLRDFTILTVILGPVTCLIEGQYKVCITSVIPK